MENQSPKYEPEGPPRMKMESIGQVVDTKSFIVPARRSSIWIWITISVLLPLLMSGAYFMLKKLWH